MPDLYANMRIKNPHNYYEYQKLNPDGNEIPDHYIKFIEPVNEEMQRTHEKNWSFKTKNYEITENRIKQLREYNVKITPSNYEWLIDTFEKLAINDNMHAKETLKRAFRTRMPQEIECQIGDEIIDQVYDPLWKLDREKRKNRSFIR